MAVNVDDTTIKTDDEVLSIVLTDEGEKYEGLELGKQPESNQMDKQQPDNRKGSDNKSRKEDAEELLDIELDASHNGQRKQDTANEKDANENDFSFKELVKYGIDKGIFTDTNFDEIKDAEDTDELLQQVMQKELQVGIEEGINERFKVVNERAEGLIEHIMNGGSVADYVKVAADDYSKITEKELIGNSQLQEKIVREYYKQTTNWSDDKINKFIVKHKDLDELKDEARSSLQGVQQLQSQRKEQLLTQTKKQREEFEKQQLQRVEKIRKTIEDTKEFAGMPISTKLKSTVRENVIEDKTFVKINSDLDKYRVNLAILDSLGLLDGDASKLTNLLEGKATKNVKKEIESYDFKRSTTKRNQDNNNDDSIHSLMKSLDKEFNKFNI